MKLSISQLILCSALSVLLVTGFSNQAHADAVSFLVDADDWDANGDGFINGTEFSPTGTDGTLWTFVPLANPGLENLQLDEVTGLRFGGGGNSSWEFQFTVDRDILLESYALTDTFGFVGDTEFDLVMDGNVISSGNAGFPQAGNFLFNDGPFLLNGGSTVNFLVTNAGPTRQSFLAGFNYTSAVPEPTSASLLFGLGGVLLLRRRRR